MAAASGTTYAAVAMASGPVNVAQSKPTYGDTAFATPTSRGNDGIDGYDNSGNWTHADYPTSATPYPGDAANAPNPYWEVDLQGSFNLDNIIITDRVGCCDPSRLNGSTVTLFGAGGAIVGTETLAAGASSGDILTFTNGGSGYAAIERVRIDGVTQYFQFSEFEATATITTPINWAAGASGQYYNSTGTPVNTYSGQEVGRITDGNPNTVSHPNDSASAGYYVDIDLGQEIFIDNLDITGRLDSACCDDRLFDYTIAFIDENGTTVHSMAHAGGTKATENIDVIGDFGGLGPQAQFVRIINSNGANYGPQIGELEVYGVIPEPSSSLFALTGALLLLHRRRR